MKNILSFLSYHNAVPIFFGILFLGAGATFAASPEARQAVFLIEEKVASIDNSYILNTDVAQFPYEVQVTGVSEDEHSYYVAYTLQTIDLVNGAWRDTVKERVLAVSKSTLEGRDLGTYASQELAQVRDAERARLVETQSIERTLGRTQKVVAVEYSGLVGKLIDSSTKVFEPYVPPVPAVDTGESESEGQVAGASTAPLASGGSASAPSITIFGNNPAHINVGDTYADLGFLATDSESANVATYTYLNGKKVRAVTLDTSSDATYTITYEAIDPDGNAARAERTVIVGSGEVGGEEKPPEGGGL